MDEALIRRIPPHSAEAERSVVGSMLMSEDAVITASEILQQEDFYDRSNGILFETMCSLNRAGKAIDPVTVQDALLESVKAQLPAAQRVRAGVPE